MGIKHSKLIGGFAYFLFGVYGRYNRAFAPWSSFYPSGRISYMLSKAIDLLTYRINVGNNADVPRFRDITDGIFCCSVKRRCTEPTACPNER